MKKYLLLVALLFLAAACGGSDDDMGPIDPTPPPTIPNNKAPSVPVLVGPVNDLKCTDNPLDFSWNASTDPEGDAVSYTTQVATNTSFSADLQTATGSSVTANFTLKEGVPYYWRVSAKDNKNLASAYSTVWKFYSEGAGVSNHLPFAASLKSPALNSKLSVTSTTLKWSATDLDDDPLKYDVYFGNTNPPALVAENISETSYEVDLVSDTTYYWKIVVKDNAGGETIGQIWTFLTE